MSSYHITSKEQMSFYFLTLNEIEPASVLDMGMFLKRIGAVSRSALDEKISEDILLDGVDFRGTPELPIYHPIYNHIFSSDQIDQQKYDVAVLLQPEDIFSRQEIRRLLRWCPKSVSLLLTDLDVRILQDIFPHTQMKALGVSAADHTAVQFHAIRRD